VLGLERLNEMLLQLFNERFVSGDAAQQVIPLNDNFLAINGYLEARDDTVFERHPLALLELFWFWNRIHQSKASEQQPYV
jgi:UTP:GlnB (protein PII) uridylyltransferase